MTTTKKSLLAIAIVAGVAAAIVTAVSAAPAAQDADQLEAIRGEIDALRKGQDEIRASLDEIKKLVAQRPQPTVQRRGNTVPPNTVIDLAGQPVKGQEEAKIAVIEFSDYQCPYCARFVRDTYPALETQYVKTGKIRYAMMDFPLRNHPHAFKAAEAASCAGDGGKFWEMHSLLFENQRELAPEQLPGYAAQLGLDDGQFRECLEGSKQEEVRDDLSAARRAGVSATPTFLIGWVQPDGKVKISEQLRGAQQITAFQSTLDTMLENGPDGDDEADG